MADETDDTDATEDEPRQASRVRRVTAGVAVAVTVLSRVRRLS